MGKYTEEKLNKMSVHTLRVILRSEFGGVPGVCNKNELMSLYPNARFTFKTDPDLVKFDIKTQIT